jgi:hypothetical protein
MPSLRVQLAQAREQVEHAQRRIEEQIDLIQRLRADGHDPKLAELLLVTLVDVRLKFSRHLDALEGKP